MRHDYTRLGARRYHISNKHNEPTIGYTPGIMDLISGLAAVTKAVVFPNFLDGLLHGKVDKLVIVSSFLCNSDRKTLFIGRSLASGIFFTSSATYYKLCSISQMALYLRILIPCK